MKDPDQKSDRPDRSDSPIVDEVRARRSEISRRFGDDLMEYGKHLLHMQEAYRARLVSQIAVVPGRPPPAERAPPK